MEAQWQADRSMLRRLMQTQPTWTQRDYAESIGRSLAWVKKWTKRLRAAPPDDVTVLHSQSCARKHPPPKLHHAVIDRLLEIGSAPPAPLHRISGPTTIRYYLEHDPELRALQLRVPRSTRKICQMVRVLSSKSKPTARSRHMNSSFVRRHALRSLPARQLLCSSF